VILEHLRVRLHQAFEQLEADLGIAMLKQHRGGHDIQGAEQPRGRPAAKVWIEIPAPQGAALDLRDKMGGQEALLLHQSAGHRGPREHGRGGILLVHSHDLVRPFAIGGCILTGCDQGFERVRKCERVSPISRRAEFGMDGTPPKGARRAEAEKRYNQQRRTAIDATTRTHSTRTRYSPYAAMTAA